jgi:hypothetical protein
MSCSTQAAHARPVAARNHAETPKITAANIKDHELRLQD